MTEYRRPPNEHLRRPDEAGLSVVGPSGIYSALRPDTAAWLGLLLWGIAILATIVAGAQFWPSGQLLAILGLVLSLFIGTYIMIGIQRITRIYTGSFVRARDREELGSGTGVLWAGFLGPRAEVSGEAWWFRCVGALSEFRSAHYVQAPTRFAGSARLVVPPHALERGRPMKPLRERFRAGLTGSRSLIVHDGILHLIWLDSDAPPVSTLQAWLGALTAELELNHGSLPRSAKVEELVGLARAAMQKGEPVRFSLARFRELETELEALAAVALPEVALVPATRIAATEAVRVWQLSQRSASRTSALQNFRPNRGAWKRGARKGTQS